MGCYNGHAGFADELGGAWDGWVGVAGCGWQVGCGALDGGPGPGWGGGGVGAGVAWAGVVVGGEGGLLWRARLVILWLGVWGVQEGRVGEGREREQAYPGQAVQQVGFPEPGDVLGFRVVGYECGDAA